MVLEVDLFFQNHSLTNIHIRTNWRELPLVTKSKCKGSEYQWHTPIWTLRRSLHAAFNVETYKNNIAFSNGGSSHWWVGHPITDHSLWSTPLCKQDKQAKSPDSSGFIVTTFTWEQRDLCLVALDMKHNCTARTAAAHAQQQFPHEFCTCLLYEDMGCHSRICGWSRLV